MVAIILPGRNGPMIAGGTGGGSLSAAFVASASDASGGATVTFTGIGIGADVANRVCVVAVSGRTFSGSDTITSVTIGGVTATLVSGSYNISAGLIASGIYYATGVSGTTANVVVVWSAAPPVSAIGTYRIVTPTPTPTFGGGTNGFGAGLSTGITVPASGFGIAVYGCRTGNGSVTWTNTTAGAGDWAQFPTGARTFGGSSATASATISASSTGSSAGDALSVAAWGP